MKIAIVITHLGGGGAERVGVSLANVLANRGHQVVIATDLNTSGHYSPNDKVKVVHFVNKAKQSGLKWFLSIFTLRKVFKREKPNVVIGIMQLCSIVSKMASFGMNIPVVMTEHNTFEQPASSPLSKIDYISKFHLNTIYPLVTVLTQADKDVIGSKLKNVVVMPNPLALEPVKDISLKEKIILAAGRLDGWYYKGFDVLIKAFSMLVQGSLQPSSEELIVNRGGWKLLIAGTGSEKSLNYLKGLCKENGVEDYVEFLGFQKDIEKLYQKASIFVLSSRYEGFGLVLIEAMSQGCACIACDYKGRQREILAPLKESEQSSKFKVQGSKLSTQKSELETWNSELGSRNSHVEVCETGILCEPDNVNALAEAMRKMITDDDYRESVRMKAVERSKYYSLENTADRWEELLNQLVEK